YPQREAAPAEVGDIVARDAVVALDRAPSGAGDECGEIAVAVAVDGVQHELQAVVESELAADDERQPGVLRREMRAHRARERAFVGDRERGVALRLRAFHQLLRMRGAAQERERRQAMQLGIAGKELAHTVRIYGMRRRPGRIR